MAKNKFVCFLFWQKPNCELLFKEKSVCVCPCIHMHVCGVQMCTCVHTHTEVTGQYQAYSSVTHHVILGTGPSQNLQFIVLGRWPGQQAPRICLSPAQLLPPPGKWPLLGFSGDPSSGSSTCTWCSTPQAL